MKPVPDRHVNLGGGRRETPPLKLPGELRIQIRIPAVAMSHFANVLLKEVPDAEQRERIADQFALMMGPVEATAFRFIAGLPQK